jgi:hypothetical protein
MSTTTVVKNEKEEDFKYDYFLSDKDSFLNVNFFNKLKKEIQHYFHFLNSTQHTPKILDKIRSKFNYLKTFKTKGVQGITGILTCKGLKDYPIVFKVSVEIDKSVEHEFSIMNSLNDIRLFCPHFVGSLGMFKLPISRTYVYTHIEENEKYDEHSGSATESGSETESEEENEDEEFEEYTIDDVDLFMNDEQYLPINVLFMEYVSSLSFSDICRKSRKNKNLILSQILMVLSALSISQKYDKFTHYDLHVDNVLIRQCEPEAIFIYKINDSKILVPTFGFYPVIIDMGSSYSNALENNDMKSSIANYDNGLQPTIYDPLNDLHHFLISALYDIEYDSEEYYFLSTRMLYFFRNIPILRKRGWKQLPNNLLKLTLSRVNKCCSQLKFNYTPKDKDVKKKRAVVPSGLDIYPIWIDLNRDIIEHISYGIKLPWTNNLDPYLESLFSNIDEKVNKEYIIDESIKLFFPKFIHEFQRFDDLDNIDDPNDLFYILKEFINIVYLNYDKIIPEGKTMYKLDKTVSKNLLNLFKKNIIKEFSFIPNNLDWDGLLISCKFIISILNVMFFNYVEPHVELINNAYLKTEIRSSIELIKWLKKNTSIRTVYSEKTILYVWDADNKTQYKKELIEILNKEDIVKLNNLPPVKSENVVLSKIN